MRKIVKTLLLPFIVILEAMKWLIGSILRFYRFITFRSRMTKKYRLAADVFIGLLLGGAVIFTMYQYLVPSTSQAAWFDDSWGYRQRIDVTSTNGSTQSNVFLSISLDTATLITAGKLQSSCQDIRVTDVGGKLLSYHIGRTNACNNAATTIDFLINSFINGNSTYYVYYGNSSVLSADLGAFSQSQASNYSVGTLGSLEKATAPIAYWKFDEGQGVVANNSQWKSSGTVTNLTANPSFETNLSNVSGAPGGSAPATSTATRDSTYSVVGSYSAKWVRTSAGDSWFGDFSSTMSNSTTYIFSFWVRTTSAARVISLKSVTNNGGEVTCQNSVSITSSWQRLSCSFTTASSGTINGGYLLRDDAVLNDPIYIDGVQIEASSTASNYCDGSITGNGTHAWTGTAHASTSTCSKGTDGMITAATWQSADQCISEKCLKFNGSSSYVDTGVSQGPQTAASYSFWVKPNSVSITQVFMGQYNGTNAYMQFFAANTDVYFRIHQSIDTIYIGRLASGVLESNKWQYFVGTWDGGTTSAAIKIYKNGVQIDTTNSQAGSFTAPSTSSIALQIGAQNGSSVANGLIDEPKVYDFALSAAQIKANYVAKTGNESSQVLGSSQNTNLSNGLVGYWKMDESSWTNNCSTTSVTDASGNANNGTSCPNSTGVSTLSTGKFGNAPTFNGTSQYVSVASSTSLSPTTAITMSAWINPSSVSGTQEIMQKSGAYGMKLNVNKFRGYRWGGSENHDSTTSLTTGTWYFVAMTFDGTTHRTYVNGVLEASETEAGSIPSGSNALIIASNSGSSNFFSGKVDEARIYNRALSPDEVKTLYNFAPGPVGLWNFDEGSGTVANDKSGNGYTGTLTNGPTWTAGKYGKAISFDGSNDYVDMGNVGAYATYFTASAWIYKTTAFSGSVEWTVMGKRNSTTAGWQLGVQNTGILIWRTFNGSQFSLPGTAVLATGQWYHVEVVHTDGSASIYINGVLDKTGSITNPAIDSTVFKVAHIGVGSGGAYWDGKIDDTKIYNYTRTSGQIVEDMNGGHPLGGSPVGSQLSYWKFDEGYGTTANNTIPGQPNFTLASATNDPAWTQSGKFGKALDFDGAASVSTEDYADATFTAQTLDQGTLTFWVKPNDLPASEYYPISTYNGVVGESGGWLFAITSTGGCSFRGNSIYSDGCGTGAFTANTWTHVALVVDKTNAFRKIYINGTLKTTGTANTYGFRLNSTLRVGMGSWCATSNDCYFPGMLDEVKIYNAPLTEDQIKIDINRGQGLVLGSTSDNSSATFTSASSKHDEAHKWCVPGDTTSCAAPVGNWEFDERTGTTVNDNSGNGNTGTWQGTTTNIWTVGKVGPSGKFNGSNNWVSVADANSLDASSAVSLETWIYTTGTGGSYRPHFICKGDNGSNGSYCFIIETTGFLRLFLDVGSGWVASVTGTSNFQTTYLNQWVHVAAVYNGSTAKIYINGTEHASASQTGTLRNSTGVLGLGGQTSVNSSTLTGMMDQVRVYNYARTPAQIAWDYNRGGPVGWWKMDECQGTVANDSSGKGISGTWNGSGSGTITSAGTCSTSSTAWGSNSGAGKRNYAMTFDGTDDYVAIDSPSLFGNLGQNLTVSSWFKLDPSWTNQAVIFQLDTGSGGTANGLQLIVSSTKTLGGFRVDIGSGNWPNGDVQSSTILNTSQWYHGVFVSEGSALRLYIDGVLVRSDSIVGSPLDVVPSTTRIGARTSTNRLFNGQIDDVRAYNYALTATQVKDIYNNGAAAFQPSTGTP